MLNKLADAVVRFRWPFIFLFLAITMLLALQLPRVEMDPAIKSMLPPDLPARVNLDKIEDIFGGTEMVIVVLSADDVLHADTLKRTKAISKQMERVKQFDRVISLFTLKQITGESGDMIVDPAVKRIPKSEKRREKLRAELKDNDMVYGSVVSKDFTHTAIIGFLSFKATDEDAIGKVNQIIADNPGPGEITVGGMPFIRTVVAKNMRTDMRRLMPSGILVMLVFLLICFRQLRGVLLPADVTLAGIIFAMGCLPIVGWKIHMVTIILPMFLIAVANNYAIHVMARYQEDNRRGREITTFELARSGFRELAKPILATALTTVVGVLCLMSHIVIPARQLGVLAAIGVMYALFGSLFFIPAMLAVLPRAKPISVSSSDDDSKSALLDGLLRKTVVLTTRHPKAIIGCVIALMIPLSFGIAFLVVDTDPVNFFPDDSPVAKVTNIVNRNFGGSSSISAVAKGDIKDPSIMKHIDALERHLAAHRNIGNTTSISKVVKEMNQVMHDGDTAYEKVPPTRDAIAQYFLLYSMSGDPDDFDKFVDYPYQHAQVIGRVNESRTSVATDIVRYVRDYVDNLQDSPFIIIGGFADLFSELVGYVVRGQVISLLLSIVLVAILVGTLFRSFYAAVLAALPLGMALTLLFGLMGYLSIELNVATAMLSSIMIGVGVDYTIHFLWRYRAERQRGLEYPQAIFTTLTTSGRGIVFNALSVIIGFAVLMVSAFLPIKFFGFLVLVSIFACLLGALVVLPAICLVARPGFLEAHGKGRG